MFGSSSPFGATSTSPFGGTSAPSNPFGTTTTPFGVSQTNNLFGAKPFGSTPTPFGGQTGSSLFGSGTATGVFGATQPSTFGAASTAFGASSSTPAFGATNTAFGSGNSVFGQKPASPFGGFGTTTQPQVNPFGAQPTFGQTQPAFGSTPFASSTPTFGATSTPAFGSTPTPAFGAISTPAFGATSTPAFGSTTTPAFGASTPAFGSSVFGQTTPVFGGSPTQAPSFGSSTPTPTFGAQSSAFGATTTPAFGGGFGGTSLFGGQQRVGSRAAAYATTNDTEAGVGGQAGKFMSISAMPAYKNKSHEELRWDDHQAGDKGGPNAPGAQQQQQPATSNLFGQVPQTPSPFGATSTFGQTTTPNPFAASTTPSIFASKPAFGAATTSTPAFSSFGATPATPSSFGAAPASTPAFGASTTPAFGMPSTTSAFGQTSTSVFGASTFGTTTPAFGAGAFGASTPAFGSSTSAFGNASTPAFGSTPSSSPFGTSSLFGNTSASGAGGLFATPAASQPFGQTTTPAFGASSTSAFGSNLFNSTSPGSIFGPTKSAGATQSTPSLFANFGSTPAAGQTQGAFSFPSFQTSQQAGTSIFGNTTPASNLQNGLGMQQPAQNTMTAVPTPVTNPFGTMPAMPQMMIGRSAGSGPSVQYGISSMPVSEKPLQVRTTSLLTPRHITQRSKVRLSARRYHPKKDSPKVSFFSDGEETPTTPRADVLFVPRENPRALFIRQPEQSPLTPTATKDTPDAREIATPVQENGLAEELKDASGGGFTPPPAVESPVGNWASPNMGDEIQEAMPVPASKSPEKQPVKQAPKTNGVREEHNHRGNGFMSITGHRAGEAAIAYEHGADIEALMPKLRHSDYITEPRIQELAAKERAEPGYCRRVPNFVIGRKGYGSVKFLGETDVRRLDIESIIQFNRCEVLVYMDESKKPVVGQGLNKPAEVTLLNVKCVDKKTGQHHAEGPEVDKFERRLKKKTEEQGAKFVSYNGPKGEWKFQVQHFSRYGLRRAGAGGEEAPIPVGTR